MRRYVPAVLVMVLGAAAARAAGSLEPYDADSRTPPIELEDLDGEMHTLADYRSQVVLVNFWGTWCAPCVQEMPSMRQLYRDMAGRPFALLAVNVRQSEATVRRFLSRIPLEFPVLMDPNGATARAWQVRGFPTTYLIDHEGRIQYAGEGPIYWEDDPRAMEILNAMMPDRD